MEERRYEDFTERGRQPLKKDRLCVQTEEPGEEIVEKWMKESDIFSIYILPTRSPTNDGRGKKKPQIPYLSGSESSNQKESPSSGSPRLIAT